MPRPASAFLSASIARAIFFQPASPYFALSLPSAVTISFRAMLLSCHEDYDPRHVCLTDARDPGLLRPLGRSRPAGHARGRAARAPPDPGVAGPVPARATCA